MSQQAAQTFIDNLTSDPVLAQQAAGLTGSVEDIVRFAQQHGYAFTAEELEAVLPTPDAGERELSENELEQVSGGEWILVWHWDGTRWVRTWTYQPPTVGWFNS